ncbi:hypothetical protein [Shewanella sp. UCD-KL12]|uniref:hypothetical protein n=1 Tax=Shewanella sp. UCD-KL12 TaxID=1917163 RepID=UPI0009FA354B|nr:hypothetical protein [Shewanella sp. UCD-KL12]
MIKTISIKPNQTITMLKSVIFIIVGMLSINITYAEQATHLDEQQIKKGDHNGQVLIINGHSKAWETSSQQWINLDNFWQNWANSRGGITWGRSKDYPAYEQVKEQDTLLIELDTGTCMMEFWHSRWRRANDVRRWDDAFNTYSACSNVFD